MAPMLPPSKKNDQFKDKIPRGLRVLLPRSSGAEATTTNGASAQQAFGAQLNQEAAAMERWWAQPRWQHTKRVYSGTYSC